MPFSGQNYENAPDLNFEERSQIFNLSSKLVHRIYSYYFCSFSRFYIFIWIFSIFYSLIFSFFENCCKLQIYCPCKMGCLQMLLRYIMLLYTNISCLHSFIRVTLGEFLSIVPNRRSPWLAASPFVVRNLSYLRLKL